VVPTRQRTRLETGLKTPADSDNESQDSSAIKAYQDPILNVSAPGQLGNDEIGANA